MEILVYTKPRMLRFTLVLCEWVGVGVSVVVTIYENYILQKKHVG